MTYFIERPHTAVGWWLCKVDESAPTGREVIADFHNEFYDEALFARDALNYGAQTPLYPQNDDVLNRDS